MCFDSQCFSGLCGRDVSVSVGAGVDFTAEQGAVQKHLIALILNESSPAFRDWDAQQ